MTSLDEDDSEEDDAEHRVAIGVSALHLVPNDEAIRIFEEVIGSGGTWASPLMQYRTTSDFQADWKIEVGNWLERGRRLGYLDHLRRNVIAQQQAVGQRDAGDQVHRNVTQQLAQAMATHYLVGTGWAFHAWEPMVAESRRSGIRADVDLQLMASGVLVDFQVKASGTLGLHDNQVDLHIQQGVRNASDQLPLPAMRPSLIVMSAQRGYWLSADIGAIEAFVGGTTQYPDDTVLLHDDSRGEFQAWPHISGIVVLDHRRSVDGTDYGCVLVQNPWASHPVDPAWFPRARCLCHSDGIFTWLRGHPSATTFPPGTACFAERAETQCGCTEIEERSGGGQLPFSGIATMGRRGHASEGFAIR